MTDSELQSIWSKVARSYGEDATQDAMMWIYEAEATFPSSQDFERVLYSMARLKFLTQANKSKREPPLDPELTIFISSLPTQEGIVELNEELETANPILVLSALGYEIHEISQFLKIPEGTVKSRKHRLTH